MIRVQRLFRGLMSLGFWPLGCLGFRGLGVWKGTRHASPYYAVLGDALSEMVRRFIAEIVGFGERNREHTTAPQELRCSCLESLCGTVGQLGLLLRLSLSGCMESPSKIQLICSLAVITTLWMQTTLWLVCLLCSVSGKILNVI